MNVIEEIRNNRIQLLNEEHKKKILDNVKYQLTYKSEALVEGAAHFRSQECVFRENHNCRAPFKYHPAIEEWLRSLGFKTSRYCNKGGIDQGLSVWI